MKFFLYLLTSVILFTGFNLYAEEFKFKVVGKQSEDNIIKFPDGGRFVSFHHTGGFETNIGKYGEYQCRGNILYNNESKLENMFFACEFIDQIGDIFISMGKRFKGSDEDRAVGRQTIIQGKGFWKRYIGYNCSYAIEYVGKTIFAPTKCKV